ncbi:hypothetical protein JCM1841_002501 [Sporobolomyces salmonicolor]
MTTVAPIPLRPLNRTRRRSSSVNAISDSSPTSSSSEFDPHHARWTRGSRPDGKRCKRSRTATQQQRDGSFAQPPSPLKHSQRPFPAPYEDAAFWDQPSPFSSRLPPLAPTFGFPAPPPDPSSLFSTSTTFTTSTTDFALPSSSSQRARYRHASAGSPSSTNTFPFQQPSPDSSPKPYSTTFDDSSFSSLHSSAPPSPPSASTTPPSPLAFGFTSAADVAAPLFLGTPLTSSAPSGMVLCDLDEDVPGTAAAEEEEDRKEAERLHHAAFEQLRKATQAEEEGFVERMRRWEVERAQDRARAVRDDSARLASGSADGGDEADDDELEVTLDHPPLDGRLRCAGAAKAPNPAGSVEVDELARRMRGGACELEDYALVREVQARSAAANA